MWQKLDCWVVSPESCLTQDSRVVSLIPTPGMLRFLNLGKSIYPDLLCTVYSAANGYQHKPLLGTYLRWTSIPPRRVSTTVLTVL